MLRRPMFPPRRIAWKSGFGGDAGAVSAGWQRHGRAATSGVVHGAMAAARGGRGVFGGPGLGDRNVVVSATRGLVMLVGGEVMGTGH